MTWRRSVYCLVCSEFITEHRPNQTQPVIPYESQQVVALNIQLHLFPGAPVSLAFKPPVIIDIRPAGVSVLPDANVDGINNDSIAIIMRADDDSGATTNCRNVIGSIGGEESYNNNSLAQNIVCRYIFWQRLEQRIDLKKCLLEGNSKC